ncbi:MAG TPA: extracellular solute-binding protein [Fimbriimonadaceae bacterium]|nr:extracellular solute-binding protein [Fimbriimonadaceae bacterium]
MRRLLFTASLLIASALISAQEIQIRMMAGSGYGIPPKEATATTTQVRRAVFEEFHRRNPGIRVVNAGGLSLADGNQADNMFLMSMAGDKAPDLFYVNFRQYYTFLEQGFARPLDDLIARDPGVMERVNPTVKKVLTSYDGKIYAIPFFQVAVALYYRKDHFQAAGLDPSKPPKTWDEFYRYCQKLSQVQKGRFGFIFSTPPGYHWQNFLYQAGGEVVAPTESGIWQSRINSPEAEVAVNFFKKLVVEKWKNEKGEIVGPAAAVSAKFGDDVRMGNTSMWFAYTNDVVLQNNGDLSPSLIGVSALPAGPAGTSNEINAGMWAINSQVTDPKKIEACWKFIKFFAGDDAARINTDKMVELGMGNLVNPTWLKKFGYQEYLAEVDSSYVKANDELFKTGHPEPYGKNCQQIYTVLDQALDTARLDPSKNVHEILVATEKDMNQKLLGYIPPEVLAKQRIWAFGILTALILLAATWAGFAIRKAIRNQQYVDERIAAGSKRSRIYTFMAICLAPAALSILVWAYYPLARGLTIAFQDYKITQGAKWVGLDNFIGVFSQPVFYQSLYNSFLYVFLLIVIGFFLPIFLALALNEIPRGKVFFRTVFYLPAMTSSIVIAFLWKQFYDKTDQGLLNVIFGPFIEHVINPFRHLMGWEAWPVVNDWLGNPSLAIFAVVIPGIWAGAGPGSILYLAALKNISEDRYEAADLDGANWWHKIVHITLPGLKPLILINLLGVFIAGFKAMENIFVLTQGGPLNSTRTIGLEVWQNAFMYLKFGYATAAAWVMGAILIGFTLIQIRSLLKMRFTTAKV